MKLCKTFVPGLDSPLIVKNMLMRTAIQWNSSYVNVVSKLCLCKQF